jgi:hypothetical protein
MHYFSTLFSKELYMFRIEYSTRLLMMESQSVRNM